MLIKYLKIKKLKSIKKTLEINKTIKILINKKVKKKNMTWILLFKIYNKFIKILNKF